MTRQQLPPAGTPLTPVERRVLTVIAQGGGRRGAAAALGTTETAVKEALARIGARLGVRTQAGMVGAAIRSGQLRVSRYAVPEPVICGCVRCETDALAGRGLPARLAADCRRRAAAA
ncbi:hypothetical protein [Kitasatospora atroaurantiaca]|uniref:HTH luxR-type domain-containing protein n=1 Tax=Kitasatospora atroaurantiaca TaxID=285545 RepID=A0A561EN82_9ACTN|nr:hypothetical protein [Kitasatospora atroaurantiaca]TWE17042.1 hypothetical protein FB465_2046 [Kitasatospora atroaurantiaca]